MNKLKEIDLKFKSGNEIPVKRASLTLDELEYIRNQLIIRQDWILLSGAFCFTLGVAITFLVSR
mgnify:FL=1